MKLSSLFVCLATSLTIFTGSAFATDPKALKVADCLKASIAKAELPREADIKVGTPWTCQMVHFWPSPSPNGDGPYVQILPEAVNQPDYLFDKVPFGFSDRLQNPAPVHEYAIYDNGKFESLMSILDGVQDGFRRNYVRVTPNGYLLTEQTVFNSDVNVLGNSLSPVSACSDNSNGINEYVIQYALCRPQPQDANAKWDASCFDQASLANERELP